MKTQITLLILVAALTGCGKELPTASADTTNAPASTSLTCPADMTLLAARPGHAETCVDTTPSPAAIHANAVQACAVSGKTLCTAAQLVHRIDSGADINGAFWALDSSGANAAYMSAGEMHAFTGTGALMNFLCCSR